MRRGAGALGAWLVMLAVVLGIPFAVLAGGRLPGRVPPWHRVQESLTNPDDGSVLLYALTAVAVVVWALVTWFLLAELASALMGRRTRDAAGPLRLPQAFARRIVATALLAVAAGSVSTATAEAATAAPAATVTGTVQAGGVGEAGAAARRTAPLLRTQAVTVQEGDTLWSIAERHLGDGDRWPEIMKASAGIQQPGGQRLTDPNEIFVGWTLNVPLAAGAPATPPAKAPARPAPAEAAAVKGTTAPAPVAQPARTPVARDASVSGRVSAQGAGDAGIEGLVPSAEVPVAAAAVGQAGAAAVPAPAGAVRGTVPGAPVTPQTRWPAFTSVAGTSVSADEEGVTVPYWVLAGLSGGGVVLAGSVLILLRQRRASQARHRRPGHAVARPPQDLAPVERTVAAHGAVGADAVELVAEVLSRLAAQRLALGEPLPRLAAVQLGADAMDVHLAEPVDLAAPWQPLGEGLRWRLPLDADLGAVGLAGTRTSPWPFLVTVGADDEGGTWMLNCEEIGTLSVTGDGVRAADFARYIAAEIGANPWSQQVDVDLVGTGVELAGMREGLRGHEDGDSVLEDLAREAASTARRSQDEDVEAAEGRARLLGEEVWTARMLVIDATVPRPGLDDLVAQVFDLHRRTGVAVVVCGETAEPLGVELRVGADGRAVFSGLEFATNGLTVEEATGIVALLSVAEDHEPVALPVPEETEGWRGVVDESGALRDELVDQRPAVGSPASVLPAPDSAYLRVGATLPEDLANLAPAVAPEVRERVEGEDPDLDEDVRLWLSDDCPLPRLALLGPVRVRARHPLEKRRPYYTELVTYLWSRAHGATPEEVAEDFGITPARVRTDVKVARDWLGADARTGERHVPDARESAAARRRGTGAYEVQGLLVDWDLFRRLRARGEARGADGIGDLKMALSLVGGRPLSSLRAGGWAWLVDVPLEQSMVVAVADVAHVVVLHCLHSGDLKSAQEAALLACAAVPDEDIARLDLAAVMVAQGHPQEAKRMLVQDVCDRSDDGLAPEELSERTQELLDGHEWLAAQRRAS